MQALRWIVLLSVLSSSLTAARVSGRYIVELNMEPVAEHVAALSGRFKLQSTSASTHRARVRAQQQQVSSLLEQHQARILDSIDTVANALFVEIPDSAAAQLAATPGSNASCRSVRST